MGITSGGPITSINSEMVKILLRYSAETPKI